MNFHIGVNSSFLEIWADTMLEPVGRKRLLTLLNDFEDGVWRLDKFQQFIWNNIAETALTRREREVLQSQPFSILTRAAANLRFTDADSEADFGKGSEIAEIALYGIMKHHYKALSVVPKIFYKQNVQDNAKGADSVHIVLEPDNQFSLWLGEAKFYNGIENARFANVIQTISNSLETDKIKKENSIITNVSDLDDLEIDPIVKAAIKDALSQEKSIDDLKPRINVPILLLHECPITATAKEFTHEYIAEATAFHKERALAYFTKHLSMLSDIHKYSTIGFHLILFPVLSKQAIIEKFFSIAQSLRA